VIFDVAPYDADLPLEFAAQISFRRDQLANFCPDLFALELPLTELGIMLGGPGLLGLFRWLFAQCTSGRAPDLSGEVRPGFFHWHTSISLRRVLALRQQKLRMRPVRLRWASSALLLGFEL
jgi:hypothetical protein